MIDPRPRFFISATPYRHPRYMAPQVRVQDPVVVHHIHVVHRSAQPDASVVDQHIQAPEPLDRGLRQPLHIFFPSHVRGHGQGLPAVALDL